MTFEVYMPIYEYRCECGRRLDVLVRGGGEPTSCTEAGEASDWCSRGGALTKLLSAPNVGRSGATGYDLGTGKPVNMDASCGRCGNTPGSCQDD